MLKSLILVLAVTALSIDGAVISKRQIGFTGGFSPVSVDDVEVKKMADFATAAISANSNTGPVKLIKILKAETQVVAGKNYKLNLELSSGNNAALPCEVVIFDQPWSNTRKIIRSSCAPNKRNSRKTTSEVNPAEIIPDVPTHVKAAAVNPDIFNGGIFLPAKVDDAKIREIASFATTNLSNGANGVMTLVQIIKAETQAVAGLPGKNYRLTLELSSHDSKIFTCEIVVGRQSTLENTLKVKSSICKKGKGPLFPIA